MAYRLNWIKLMSPLRLSRLTMMTITLHSRMKGTLTKVTSGFLQYSIIIFVILKQVKCG